MIQQRWVVDPARHPATIPVLKKRLVAGELALSQGPGPGGPPPRPERARGWTNVTLVRRAAHIGRAALISRLLGGGE
jgi:hypothetical protein